MREDWRTVRLPASLCDALERQVAGAFSTLEDALAFVIAELTRTDVQSIDEMDQALIEERLRGLGYID